MMKRVERKVVISQSMYFPWVGFLEQVRLADIYVRYDDVQFSKGGFCNRVQVKTSTGSKWMTVPLKNFRFGQRIDEVEVDNKRNWKRSHLDLLRQAYSGAPFLREMLDVVESVFSQSTNYLSEVAYLSLRSLLDYFDIASGRCFVDSRALRVEGRGSDRVLGLVKAVDGGVYITGHGAKNYLDHRMFERDGVRVAYMEYARKVYPQQHGRFTPYVTALDLIANCGKEGKSFFASGVVDWREVARDG